ncbi:MAG TPA: NAD(P)-dependent oxidoreductase [Amnibacterium sp.]|nr:NAD(P)-dependent oxidoreductase [Amnibacterium sp.]
MTGVQNADGAGRVAVLGTGIMGAAMARSLIRAGIPTTVWNRTRSLAAPLAFAGATVAASAADAVRGASVVITMLPTADAVATLVFGKGLTDAFALDAVWAQMGTLGAEQSVALARRLGEVRPDVMFVDAPVSGSRGPAEVGRLLVLASGPEEARGGVTPAFDAIGRRTLWLGDTGQGSRLKLVLNSYMSVLIEGVAESLALARRLDIDPAQLAAAIEGGPLDAPIALAKLTKMRTADYAVEFPLEWALKDVDLAVAAADGTTLPVLEALARQWRTAVRSGLGREDVSAASVALAGSASSS